VGRVNLRLPNLFGLPFLFFFLSPLSIFSKSGFIPTTLVFPPYLHSYGIQRATPAKLFLLLPFKTKFDNPQGIAVTKMISRDDSTTESDDDEVTVYGVNSGRGEVIYNTSMYGITVWGGLGNGKEEMRSPKGVACDPYGNVFICDAGNNRIVRLFNPKKKVQFVKHLGVGKLNGPSHIALDGSGGLYVSDTKNHRILVMNREGKILREITGGKGWQVRYPLGLGVNHRSEKWRFRGRDFLFFLNDSGRVLVRLNLTTGQMVRVKPSEKLKTDCVHDFLAMDYYASVYLTDKKRGTVDKFDFGLNLLTSFGKTGKGDREFVQPRGICIWKRYGQTFVAEKLGAQYYWMGTDFSKVRIGSPFPGASSAILDVRGRTTEASYISLYLLAAGSDTLKTVFKKIRRSPPEFHIRFRAPEKQGEGEKWLIVFEPTYSSYTYFEKPLIIRR